VAFEELKQRQAAMWGSAPFEVVAVGLADMHEAVVAAVAGQPGERWLDVGGGTGELALRAAATGAQVTGSDISESLVATARRQAAERGVDVSFDVADAEQLPYPDASFDIVTSSIGAIFAPDHARVASELARVCSPGGRLVMTTWTASGSVGDFFRLIGTYAPPPAEGAGSPMQWGAADYCSAMLGEAFQVEIRPSVSTRSTETAHELYAEMEEGFGPIQTLLGTLEPSRAAAFRDDLRGFFEGFATSDGAAWVRDYLLVLGRRRS
jgi:SAM-dependent methyltransferase